MTITLSYYRTSQLEGNDSGNEYISWSPFDRISIKEIDYFSDYYTEEINQREGKNVRCLNLVMISTTNDWALNGEDCAIYSAEQANSGDTVIKKYNFMALISLSNLKKEEKSTLIQDVKIDEEDCSYAVFESFGIDDLVVVALSDSIVSLHNVVRKINRSVQQKWQTRTLTKMPNIRASINANCKNITDLSDADLRVRILLRADQHCNYEEVEQTIRSKLNGLKFELRPIFSGKYIVEITFPKYADVFPLFNEEQKGSYGIFNPRSSFYQEYISASRSFWILDENRSNADANKQGGSTADGNTVSTATDQGKKTEKKTAKTESGSEESRLVNYEIDNFLNYYQSVAWIDHIDSVKNVYKVLRNKYEDLNNFEDVARLTNAIENHIIQLYQTVLPASQIPYANSGFPGSFHKIREFYQDIAEKVLKENNCNEIVVCINFGNHSSVQSEIFGEISSDSINPQSKSNEPDKLLIFTLPYFALKEIGLTVSILIHELYHYIPNDQVDLTNRKFVDIYSRLLSDNSIVLLENIDKDKFKSEETDIENIISGECGKLLNITKKILR